MSVGALALAWASVAAAQGLPTEVSAGKTAVPSFGAPTGQALADAHRIIAALELQGINWRPQNTAPRPTLDEYLPEEALANRAEEALRRSLCG